MIARIRSWAAQVRVPHVTRWPRLVIVGLLHVYRAVVSPWYGPTCRFYPSCSEYALIAVGRHGVLRGSWLAGRRLLRCHPWNPGGVDLVPPVAAAAASEPWWSRPIQTWVGCRPTVPRRRPTDVSPDPARSR